MEFLFTDIEGSTRLWEKFGTVMGEALQQHDTILENEIGHWGGQIIKHTGDGILSLLIEGWGEHIDKGYIYFAMGFSVLVEMLNLQAKKRRKGSV